MKERPILFSGPMVRAILEGRKTQTRRIVKPQPSEHHWQLNPGYKLRVSEFLITADQRGFVNFHHTIPQNPEWDKAGSPCCPYGIPGDHLWVREAHSIRVHPNEHTIRGAVWYRESDTGRSWEGEIKWHPSIHMPRWASRITLEVTGVRVERLQDISGDDARLEGCHDKYIDGCDKASMNAFSIEWYANLWERINGKGSWEKNPWVWVIDFRRIDQ